MATIRDEEVLAQRFRINRPPVLVVGGISEQPITFARLRNDSSGQVRTLDVPREDAFAFHVMLRHLKSAECWIDGVHHAVPPSDPGSTFLFDLAKNPIGQIDAPFDMVRFYITRSTLERLNYENGDEAPGRLTMPSLSSSDAIMYGLARAIAAALDDRPADLSLFAESIALAFHAHVARAYGCDEFEQVAPGLRGGLAPWQLRRVSEMMLSSLRAPTSIGAMAAECKISGSHFARAFKQTTGLTPYQWLLQKRMGAAKDLLLDPRIRISEIALACGFLDQSHFSSVFGRKESVSPGRWRRQRLK